MTRNNTLLGAIQDVLIAYTQEVNTFMNLVRRTHAGPLAESGTQTDLIKALDLVFIKDKELQEALRKAEKQQEYLEQAEQLNQRLGELQSEENTLIDLCFAKVASLRQSLREEQDRLNLLQGIHQNGLDVNTLLALSERISVTSCPPDGWSTDQPLRLHRPPYPTEDLMRASKLFSIMNVRQTSNETQENVEESNQVEPVRSKRFHQDQTESQPAFLDLDLNPELL